MPKANFRFAAFHRSSQALLALFVCLFVAQEAEGLPQGKAWTSKERLNVPGYAYLGAPRLDVDRSGFPLLFAPAGYGPSGDDAFGFRWVDSTWTVSWQVGAATIWLWPVQAPLGTHYLVWNGGAPSNSGFLFMSAVLDQGLSEPDTVAHVFDYRYEYSAAVASKRRWVVVNDIVTASKLRLFYSDSSTSWREAALRSSAQGDNGVSAATLDDTTALIAWTGSTEFGVRWGVLRGSTWTEGPPIASTFPTRPRFRPRPKGGQWLAWSTSEPFVLLTTFSDGAWTAPETLTCAYRDGGQQHYSDSPDLSRDSRQYPAVAWAAQDVTANYTICACVPTDSGFTIGEEIEGSQTSSAPTIARDVNGDVWLAWWGYFDTASWVHTYTSATASRPMITGQGPSHTITWLLSQAAPGTWWSILRASDSGQFIPIGRAQAGPGLKMLWTDVSAPFEPLRYRIRRDNVDKRYEWLSEEAPWPVGVSPYPPLDGRLFLLRVSANPSHSVVSFQVLNAAPGPLDIKVYDLRGRLVLHERRAITGGGQDTIHIDLTSALIPPTAGLYLLRVLDAEGRVSPSAKLLFFR